MCNTVNGPGKFEREPCYAEDLYYMWGEGQLEQIDDEGVFFPNDAFKKAHGIEDNVWEITIREDGDGFVYIYENTKKKKKR